VENAFTEKPQAKDDVKRLVRSYLPRFPDECRLCNQMEVCEANWYDDGEAIRLGVDDCPGLEGDSIWVTYHKDGGFVYDYLVEGSGSETGIARVVLLADPKPRDTIPVRIRDIIPFERFFEYFEDKSRYYDELDASQTVLGEPWLRVWRGHNNKVVGIDIDAAEGGYYAVNRLYKQLNGTWVYAYSISKHLFDKTLPEVGFCFLSEECVEEILESFANEGITVKER